MINKTTLDNGIRIITEPMPDSYSAAVAIWINAGPELETSKNNGISHLIEHMLFKGTSSKSPKDLVQSIEYTGGVINAFTQKESTCLYSKVLAEYVPLAIDTLLDMLLNSTIKQEDIELEKKVILDEIRMYEDTPDEVVYDILLKDSLKNHPIGLPIAGSKDSIVNITKQDVTDFMDNYYIPENIIISVAGNMNEEAVISQIKSLTCNLASKSLNRNIPECIYTPSVSTQVKDIEQTNICLCLKSLPILDKRRYSLAVIDSCLGGGMGSRLFQNIREDKGLVYCIDTYEDAYSPIGLWGVFAGTSTENTLAVINLILDELELVKNIGFSEDEINKAKLQVKGNMLMGLESPKRRASRNARSEFCYGKILTIDEICDEIAQVTPQSVKETINQVFNLETLSVSIVGPDADKYKDMNFIENRLVKNV